MFKRVAMATLNGFSEHELMTRAAALAFYTALSFAPMLVLALWIVSLFDPAMQSQLTGGLADLVGDDAAATADLVIANAQARPGVGNVAGLISIGVTLFAASAVLAQLQDALNRIWSVRSRPGRAWLGWLRSRAQAAALLLTLVLLVVISFAVSGLIALYLPAGVLAWRGVEAAFSFAVFVGVFACVYVVLPDVVIRWSDAFIGAALTAALFVLGKFGIGLYLDHSNVGGAYGPAGAVVVLLVWVYYAGVTLLLGAELTRVVAMERGGVVLPRAHAVVVAQDPAPQPAPMPPEQPGRP